ncbi:DUF433 domain-containing protein [Candidatus Rariloculus sp.]|uniref:DUF433 domain-containing protein n=1 Tax=Candidatus Rariloculus sp. TaxID=3101265 RepID=UPI003D106269
MATSIALQTLSANEAACVTGIPLKQVHRIIDTGLLGSAAKNRKGSRVVLRGGLVGLKLAYETTDILTLDGRRRLVRYLLDHPRATAARESNVSVNVQPMKGEVRKGLSMLARARKMIAADKGILSGTACIKGTRVPAHDIAEMLANGDSVRAIRKAYPALTDAQIEAAALYARAYPRRGRPRRGPSWRDRKQIVSNEAAFDELPLSR